MRSQGRPGGAGQRIAILDSGILGSHREFDAVPLFAIGFDERNDIDGHGTHVAGIATARRDGSGIHGVAYNAQPVSLKVIRDVQVINGVAAPARTTPTALATAILSAAGINASLPEFDTAGRPVTIFDPFFGPQQSFLSSNADAEASVMNMSLGYPDPRGQVRDAMQRAAGAGKIMVAALGNDRRFGPSLSPGVYIDEVAGLGIGVAALAPDGVSLASFSNSCGWLSNCIAAPGESIVSSVPNGTPLGGYGEKSGTSMAAPFVAGAAATALAAFPNVPPQEIVARMFRTADDLGNPGWDTVYGHGRLNLGRMLSPVGALSVPIGSGVAGASVPASSFAAFTGPGGGGRALAAATGEIMVLDEMGFPFRQDMSGFGAGYQRSMRDRLDTFIDPFLTSALSSFDRERGLRVYAGSVERTHFGASHQGGAAFRPSFATTSMSYDISPRLKFGVASGMGPASDVLGLHGSLVATGILGPELTDVDLIPFAGDGDSLRAAVALDEDTWLETLYHEGSGFFGGMATQSLVVGLRHVAGPFEVGMRLAQTREEGAIGGAVYSGFATTTGADTSSMGFDLAWQPVEGVSASLGYALSQIDPTSDGLTRFDTQIADSASFALSFEGPPRSRTRFTMVASMPFATRSGGATVRVPVARTLTGDVLYEDRRADLAPGTREQAIQAIFNRQVGERAFFDFATYARFNADHMRGREDYGAAIRFRLRF